MITVSVHDKMSHTEIQYWTKCPIVLDLRSPKLSESYLKEVYNFEGYQPKFPFEWQDLTGILASPNYSVCLCILVSMISTMLNPINSFQFFNPFSNLSLITYQKNHPFVLFLYSPKIDYIYDKFLVIKFLHIDE